MAVRFRFVKMYFHESRRHQIDDPSHADGLVAYPSTGYGVTNVQGNACARTPGPVEKGLWIGRGAPAKILEADGYTDPFSMFNEPGEVCDGAILIQGQGSIQSHVNGHQWFAETLQGFHGLEMKLHGIFGGRGMGVPDLITRKITMVPHFHAMMNVGNELLGYQIQPFWIGCKGTSQTIGCDPVQPSGTMTPACRYRQGQFRPCRQPAVNRQRRRSFVE